MGRLKTGTPPRIDGRTIDWAALEAQPSDAEGWTMSALSPGRPLPQLSCAITRTNDRTHAIIRERSEEHTSELQSLMRISYAVFCLKKKNNNIDTNTQTHKEREPITAHKHTKSTLKTNTNHHSTK